MISRRRLLLWSLLWAGGCVRAGETPEAIAAPRGPAPYDHVLIVSVDGLRADAIARAEERGLTAYARLARGAATWNARTDPDWTVTLPNHLDMVTGRWTEGPAGHHWRDNELPPPGLRLRGGVDSVFGVVAAAGGRCALFPTKEKFVLMPRSWNGTDTGTAAGPIHAYQLQPNAAAAAAAVIAFWEADATAAPTLAFAHFSECDAAGHAHGWDTGAGTPYAAAVAATDAALRSVFQWLDERPARAARTAVVLTADHGGGAPFLSHDGPGHVAVNFTIPFLVWGGDGAPGGDLYALNAGSREEPGRADWGAERDGLPPIRNAEAANLAAALLGLSAVPGSTVNARQDLRWRGAKTP